MHKIIQLDKHEILITHTASAVGHEEFFGPYGDCFDFHDDSDKFGAKTWEQAEGELERITLNLALKKAGMRPSELDLLFAGDLQNQCVASSQGLCAFDIPYIGLYGACSTCGEGLLSGAVFLHSGESLTRCAVVTSSHNCAAERQFRTPIEYGGQRTPTAQWTATAAGAFILEKTQKGKNSLQNSVQIAAVMAGKMVDSGVTDAANMGAAMAPAAADSIYNYFRLSGHTPDDYGAIITGDLGREGSEILCELLSSVGIGIEKKHFDCGVMMYDFARQDAHSGGSGCGCSASIMAGHFIPEMKRGKYKSILFLATGALMSPTSIQQGGSIAGIAPLVVLKAN